MKNLLTTCLSVLFAAQFANAQERVLSYPFEYEMNVMSKMETEAFYLDNMNDSGFALVLRDNRKANYVLFDKNFKKAAEFSTPIDNSILKSREVQYLGGAASGSKYHFLFIKNLECFIETADFGSKSVKHQKLYDIPKDQVSLTSFNEFNTFYGITADDKTSELIIYIVNENGSLTTKNIPFKVPENASKRRNKLSKYLDNILVVKSNDNPDLAGATTSAKLFSNRAKLDFVINDGDNPTRIFTISLTDFKTSEKWIGYEGIVSKEEKGKVDINAYQKNDKLFSVILGSYNIRIIAHDLQTGSIVNKFEINRKSQPAYGLEPTRELRQQARRSKKKLTDIADLILAMSREGNGIMVDEDVSGNLVLTIGSFHFTGGSSWAGNNAMYGYSSNLPPVHAHHYRVPGYYWEKNPREYITSYCRLLLDPSTLKIVNGTASGVGDQVKEYTESIAKTKKSEAANQFAIGKKQYYGYYNPKQKAYVVDNIAIK